MTIHHDKLAYGKLAKLNEELSEERLAQMIKELNGEEEEEQREENPTSTKSNSKKD